MYIYNYFSEKGCIYNFFTGVYTYRYFTNRSYIHSTLQVSNPSLRTYSFELQTSNDLASQSLLSTSPINAHPIVTHSMDDNRCPSSKYSFDYNFTAKLHSSLIWTFNFLTNLY